MNKTELVAAVAEQADISKKDAEKALKAFVDVVTEEMKKGEKVQLVGFGTFEVSERAAREGRNPQTGKTMKIEACKAPKFKAGKALKDAVAKLQEKVTALEAKEDKDTVFNPESLIGRIAALESKEDKDTVYDDTALAARVKALEDAPAGDRVDTTAFVRKSDLIDVANFAGTVRFKAYPADVGISNAGGGDASDHLL